MEKQKRMALALALVPAEGFTEKFYEYRYQFSSDQKCFGYLNTLFEAETGTPRYASYNSWRNTRDRNATLLHTETAG